MDAVAHGEENTNNWLFACKPAGQRDGVLALSLSISIPHDAPRAPTPHAAPSRPYVIESLSPAFYCMTVLHTGSADTCHVQYSIRRSHLRVNHDTDSFFEAFLNVRELGLIAGVKPPCRSDR